MSIIDYEAWDQKLRSGEYGQSHLLHGKSDRVRRKIIDQLECVDKMYPGGLGNYLKRARVLLQAAKTGQNPYEGYKIEPPAVCKPGIATNEFFEMESIGLEEVAHCAFVLVAGGLGERLGFSSIKLGLHVSSLHEITYLEWYSRCLRHFEALAKSKYGKTVSLPLAIMTSDDTHDKTLALLESRNWFDLKREQVTLMKQEKVPALMDSDARISLLREDTIEMKPHGHGDVHTLLQQHGLPQQWKQNGLKWIFFFQDTNALSMRSLPVCLGISKKHKFSMNSLCIPRTPGDSVGAICKLTKEGETPITVNVEYNQLDVLLKAWGMPGDVVAPDSSHSPFPGNCNILVYNLNDYATILDDTKGTVPEFVNPKYTDVTKTTFKSATRVECMMQEFARLFRPEHIVGATILDRWFSFSTIKNDIMTAGAKLAAKLPGESAFTADAEFDFAAAECLRLAGIKNGNCKIHVSDPVSTQVHEMLFERGPKIYLDPSWALTITEMCDRLKNCSSIEINGSESALSLIGNVTFTSLHLRGFLELANKYEGKYRLGDVQVENEGVSLRLVELTDLNKPTSTVRGYDLELLLPKA